MPMLRQMSMMPDEVSDMLLGDNRDKILELYKEMPEIADSDKVLILAFWLKYDDLAVVLGDRQSAFTKWFLNKSTKTESIRRPRQSLMEHGMMKSSVGIEDKRGWLEDVWHRYWGAFR